jgi:membrane dipeptidase
VVPVGERDASARAAARLHEQELVVDLHNDVNLDVLRSRARGAVRVLTDRYLPRWRRAGLDLVVLNSIPKIGLEAHPYVTTPVHNMLAMLDAIRSEIAESDGALALVTGAADIDRARSEGRVGIVIGVEGAEALGTHLCNLRMFHALGLRVLTLTWHQRNLIADGVSEPSGSGLSNLGREIVSEAERLGMLLDVSHASPRTVVDVLERTSRPIVASHSNARAVHDHERNLPDELVREIADRGGVIGVVFIARFVAAGRATIDDVVRHVLHLCEVGGPEAVALGPDYVDGCHDLIIDSRRVAGPGQPVDEPSIPFVEGLEGVEGIPDLTAALLRAGLDEPSVIGILGRNAARVLRGTLP